MVLNNSVRKLLRTEWIRFLCGESQEGPPSPFSAAEIEAFHYWLGNPCLGVIGYRHSRLERQIWADRPDLQHHFPDPTCNDSIAYRHWLDNDPDTQDLMSPMTKYIANQPCVRPLTPNGWNVVGYFSAELGVGEAGRRIADVIQTVGLPVEYIGVSADSSRMNHRNLVEVSDNPRFENTLFAINADQTQRIITLSGMSQHRRTRRIGLWFWELEQFPITWSAAFDELDEVWCASEFTYESVKSVSSIPTRLVRLPIYKPTSHRLFTRRESYIPDEFTFLFTYDFNSVMERKNPTAAVQAYCQAFGPDDGAHLILKSINGIHHRNELARIKYFTEHRPDITVMDAYLSQSRVEAQIAHSDCFVSLHRSEGFGLNIATAIAAGVPAIATGYSGNMTFTRENDPLLVQYKMVEVGEGSDPYPAGAVWAEPSIEHAANLMRLTFDNNVVVKNWAEESQQYLLERNSLNRCRDILQHLLIGVDLETA
jgi:glycosyltransferase involved in cell wall biosynthesis